MAESELVHECTELLTINTESRVTIEDETPGEENLEEALRRENLEKLYNLETDLSKKLSDIVLVKKKVAKPTQAKMQMLQELLDQPEWETLDKLVDEMWFWDTVCKISSDKSFLCYPRLQELMNKLMSNKASFPYLQLIIKRFNASYEHDERLLNAPIHYAVRQLNGEFLDWLLAQQPPETNDTRPEETPRENTCTTGETQEENNANTGNTTEENNQRTEEEDNAIPEESQEKNNDQKLKRSVDVNLRNSKKETALAILCASYDECMKVINKPIEEIKEDAEKEKHVKKQQKCKKMLPEIQVLIKKLIAAGADFNICSLQLKLPFELLLKYRSADEATTRFVDQCVQQAGQALVIGRINDSKMRVVEIYKSPMQSPEESPKESPVKVTEELLEICLRYKDQNSFQKYFSSFKITEKNVKKVIKVVLHTAVEQKLSECVQVIVDLGGKLIFKEQEYKKSNQPKQFPVRMEYWVELRGLLKRACLVADLSVVKILITNIKDLQLLNKDPVLALTLTKANADNRRPEDRKALLTMADYLITQRNIYIFKADNSGNTPLHLALKYGFHEIATSILKQRNAYIGFRNRNQQTPLDYGGYEFWKNYLDSCIEVDYLGPRQSKQILNFNLSCLEPPEVAPNMNSQEMTVIRHIAERNHLKGLLFHPIIYTFIMVKWIRLSPWMYVNFLLTFATMLAFGFHSLEACSVDTSPSLDLWIGAILGTLFIVIREILQLVILHKSYVTFENVIDTANIAGMIFVLAKGCSRLLSSFLIISFALQLTVIVGSLPFKDFSTIISMFKTVSLNFLYSILLFQPLIGSFIFAFHLTYNEPSANKNRIDNDTTATSSFHNFGSIRDAAIKTLIMTTGEFDAADIDFSGDKLLLFLVFLFFAPIVIFNLINGLAVSDIAAIRAESEWISIYKKVMLMERYERGVGNILRSCNLFIKWFKLLLPHPFFLTYECWIHVVVDQSWKILVQPLPDQLLGVLVADCRQKTLETIKKKPAMASLSTCFLLWGQGRRKPINLLFFKVPTFVTLDHAIAYEALAVAKRKLFSGKHWPLAVEKKPTASSSKQPSLTSGNVANSENTGPKNELAALQDEVRRLGDIVNQLHLSLQNKMI